MATGSNPGMGRALRGLAQSSRCASRANKRSEGKLTSKQPSSTAIVTWRVDAAPDQQIEQAAGATVRVISPPSALRTCSYANGRNGTAVLEAPTVRPGSIAPVTFASLSQPKESP